MKETIRLLLRTALIVLMIATVAFIFYQSSLTTDKSSETSESFKENVVEPILPSDTPAGSYVQDNIRKIAHFVEFFALGMEIAVYVLLFMPKIRFAVLSLLVGAAVAACDETIQIFSERGAQVADVLLDFSGFATCAVFVYVIGFLIYFSKDRRNPDGVQRYKW